MNINIKEVPRAATHCKGYGYKCPLLDTDDDHGNGDWICHMCDYLWEDVNSRLEVGHGGPLRSDACISSEMAAFDEADAHRKADAEEEERNAYCIDQCDGTDQNGMCQTCRAKGLAPVRPPNPWPDGFNPTVDMNPCGKCGGQPVANSWLARDSKNTARRLHDVECMDCDRKGPVGASAGEGIHKWNEANPVKDCGCPGGSIEHRMDCRRRDPA